MNRISNVIFKAVVWPACLLLVVFVFGCGSTKVTVLMSAGADTAKALVADVADKAQVAVGDIQSLSVTVSKMTLDQMGGAQVELLVDPVDVDLIDLTGVSALLSTVEIPAGVYSKIRLSIEDPRLVLKADPATTLTDIHLTANARMFVNTLFSIPEGVNTNVLLDFGGIHLVQQGNGGYTLTPQLRAEVGVELTPTANQGTVVSVDAAANTMVLDVAGSQVTVDISGAAIYLPGDTDTPSGTVADLVVGTVVTVEGTVNVDGVIVATKLTVVPPPAPTA